MQTVSLGGTLHEMSNPVFWNKSEKYIYIKMSIDLFSLTVHLAYVIIISVNIYEVLQS